MQEYLRQLRWLQNRNEQEKIYETSAEKLCRLKKGDRLSPVYTICLYHGMEEWNGPFSLKNMMDFGSHKGRFDAYFKDYAFHLVEANRPMDYDNFHTPLREVLEILPYRIDKQKMKKLINGRKEYRRRSGFLPERKKNDVMLMKTDEMSEENVVYSNERWSAA